MMKQPQIRTRRRRSLALAGVLSFILLGTSAGDLFSQRVVMVSQEPRHRLVWDDGDLKLLDVQIQPGDTTLNHTHSSPIMYTFISSGAGSSNGRVSANVDYATESYTHNVTNEGPGLFRIIALAHYGPAVTGSADPRPTGLPREPQLENEWFRSYRIELAPGEETAMIRHSNSAFVVQVTDGHADVSKAEGYGADLTAMGDWTERDAGSPYRVRNVGSQPLTVVINEGRRSR